MLNIKETLVSAALLAGCSTIFANNFYVEPAVVNPNGETILKGIIVMDSPLDEDYDPNKQAFNSTIELPTDYEFDKNTLVFNSDFSKMPEYQLSVLSGSVKNASKYKLVITGMYVEGPAGKNELFTIKFKAPASATNESTPIIKVSKTKVFDTNAIADAEVKVDVIKDFTLNETIGYNTFSACAAVKVEGATVYYGKLNNDKTSLSLTEIADGIVPANTGVILGGGKGASVTLTPSANEGSSVSGNALIPSSQVAGSVLSLGIDADKPIFGMHEGTIPANKAFIPFSGSGAPIRIDFGTNGIENIHGELNYVNNYNLMGQQVKNINGITIENGKKVFKK